MPPSTLDLERCVSRQLAMTKTISFAITSRIGSRRLVLSSSSSRVRGSMRSKSEPFRGRHWQSRLALGARESNQPIGSLPSGY